MSDSDALLEILARFADDPVACVLGGFPWGEPGTELATSAGPEPWQMEILEAVRDGLLDHNEAIRLAVASGHGIGKSALEAWLVLWAMCAPDTIGRITASTETQLRTRFWAELQKWFRLFIGHDLFEMTATSIFAKDPAHEKTWKVDATPWSEHNPTAFQGLHNKGRRLIILFDEASEIADVIWETIDGALTDSDTQIIWAVLGNPTSNKFRFRQCFPGGRFAHRWRNWNIDARTTSIGNKKYFQELIDDRGADDDYVRVRVYGQFPKSEVAGFIDLGLVEDSMHRDLDGTIPSDPLILAADVARFGDDASVLVFRRGRDARSIPPEVHRGRDTMFIASRIAELYAAYRPDAVFVDEGGIGAGVVDRLIQLGVPVIGVQFGAKADRIGHANETHKFANKRAEMWGSLRQWMRTGCLPVDDSLREELTGPLYTFTQQDAILLERKADMKKRGLASPDKADAYAMTFAYPVIPKEWTDAGHEAEYDPFKEAA